MRQAVEKHIKDEFSPKRGDTAITPLQSVKNTETDSENRIDEKESDESIDWKQMCQELKNQLTLLNEQYEEDRL